MVGVDGSNPSKAALRWALDQARLTGARMRAIIAWEDHLAVYLADRARWKQLLKTADRHKSGKINAKEHSIESLTRHLVGHEHHHLFTPR